MLKWLGNLVDSNEKEIKKLQPLVDDINALEPEFQKLSDEQLKAKTDEFKSHIAEATAEIRQKLAEAQAKLKESHSRLIELPDTAEKENVESQWKQLEADISALENEAIETEEDVLDELLPEAFAAVREAARRTIGQRHYDVQLMGGIVLHHGRIAEMKTGEGKTLVATLPLYLNALTDRGVHLITVNDYLSRFHAQWMGRVFHALGISIGSIQHEASFIYDPDYQSEDKRWPHLRPVSRKEAYGADITYGTNNEFGFDYLRDNMVTDLNACTQRELNYAIVDEVDNILIDEARTPLIISGQRQESLQEYQIFSRIAAGLRPGTDYKMSEKGRSIDEITESGYDNTERILKREGILKTGNLYDNPTLAHHLRNAIIAKEAYQENKEYVVKDGQVIIVDEFTGRMMPGRRYSEGLHQAIEAKAKVKVQHESMTYATVTFQNYFRMYGKLAGMTGTALTEAEEFHKIYKLEVVVIPTNKPMIRKDNSDRIYKDEAAKFKAVVNEVAELHKKGQPVLIGTVSIEKSEILSEMMKRRGIPHQVLNAKLHEKEAGIIREAGKLGAVTVATNMAGRGVDIMLGGDPEGMGQKEWQEDHEKVVELGGLFVLGTERHEARRIDNQLRGRSGRQGDPGESRFYVSLEDDIMKRFGGDRIKGLMERFGMDENTPIENPLINRSIADAQKRVEGYHFDIRKQLVEYDDVVNKQRELIYAERRKILGGADLKANILSMVKEELHHLVIARSGDEYGEGKDMKGLLADVSAILPIPKELNSESLTALKPEVVHQKLDELAEALYEQREKEIGTEAARALEKLIMLRTIDNLWIEHLTVMDHQRLQAGWAGLQQQKAVDVYKNLGAEQWQTLTEDIRRNVAGTVFHVNIVRQEPVKPLPTPMANITSPQGNKINTLPAQPARQNVPQHTRQVTASQDTPLKKVGRNDLCPCGSGKKYKHCHGK